MPLANVPTCLSLFPLPLCCSLWKLFSHLSSHASPPLDILYRLSQLDSTYGIGSRRYPVFHIKTPFLAAMNAWSVPSKFVCAFSKHQSFEIAFAQQPIPPSPRISSPPPLTSFASSPPLTSFICLHPYAYAIFTCPNTATFHIASWRPLWPQLPCLYLSPHLLRLHFPPTLALVHPPVTLAFSLSSHHSHLAVTEQ